MKWKIKNKTTSLNPAIREKEIINAIFSGRGIDTDEEINFFLSTPSPMDITPLDVEIDPKQLNIALALIHKSIEEKTPILVYGDYDADGITATGILYEALHALHAKVSPFIPSRDRHGYGLSIKGLEEALEKLFNPLIITVDNGIVANDAVAWLKEKKINIIITDHHQPGKSLPKANAIVHSQKICGAGIAWIIAKNLSLESAQKTLDLACIGTVADMMPLTGVNRQMVKYGLPAIRATKRPGLIALLKEANVGVDKVLTPTDINYTIAPRLNAMGRLEHAIDSLRLLCTTSEERANSLALLLGNTNRSRQDLTQTLLDQAKAEVGITIEHKIIIIDHEEYHEGIIGLIAGKLVESYYRPAIVISRKNGVSKASARSIKGVNITELIRSQSHLLLGVGGHPMAAGFSIKTDNIAQFRSELIQYSNTFIEDTLLEPSLNVDCEIEVDDITDSLYQNIQNLQPFGIGNPHPVFSKMGVKIIKRQDMGNSQQHLKLLIETTKEPLEALWFGHGQQHDFAVRDATVNLAFTIDQNTWKNRTKLQLLIKDITI